MGREDGCDGSFAIYFMYRTQMTQSQRTTALKQYQADFPWTENKEVFALRHLCPVHEVLSGIWNPLISGQIVNSFGQGKCTDLTVSLGISKTISLATMSQQAYAYWELRNWLTSTWLICEHFIQIHSCMYTNKREHFHKWFGTLYRDIIQC